MSPLTAPTSHSGLSGLTGLSCLHCDEALVVVNKPAGLLAVPGRGEDKQDCLSARVQATLPDALIVHRLDMATSGLMVMARGAAMQRLINNAFATRAVHKRYTAVVDGHVAAQVGEWHEIDLPILVDWPRRPLRTINPAGQASLTRWRLLSLEHASDGSPVSRLELEPVTGRSHQLRVHLQALGHPILGDALYAPANVQARSPRLLLHAHTLGLTQPQSGEPLQWHSPAEF